MPSSARRAVSPAKVNGWLGTIRNSAVTDPVISAAIASSGCARAGAGWSFEPPAMTSSAVPLAIWSGTTSVN